MVVSAMASLALLQLALWLTYGRESIDDAALLGIVKEFVKGASTARPSDLFLCPGTAEELADETRKAIDDALEASGVKAHWGVDSRSDLTRPIASICIEVEANTPLLGLIAIHDGYGSLIGSYGWSRKELRLFVFGKWLYLDRVNETELL